MSLNAFLEAAKKATAGPWHVMKDGFTKKHSMPTVYATDSDLRYVAYCGDAYTTGEPTDNQANAEFIASARNAADEVRELVEWLRNEAQHAKGCSGEFGSCKCGLDRIREIVGGGE